MTDIEKAAQAWLAARITLLEALSNPDGWMDKKKSGMEVQQPNPTLSLWADLAKAEGELVSVIMENT